MRAKSYVTKTNYNNNNNFYSKTKASLSCLQNKMKKETFARSVEDFQVLTVPKLHPPPSWKRISALFSCWQPIQGQIQAFSFVSVCLLSVLVRKLSVPTPKAVISLLCVLHKLQETSCLAPSRIGATETRPSTAVDWKSRFWPAEFHQHYVSIVGHFTCRGV